MKYILAFSMLLSIRAFAQIDTTSNLTNSEKIYGLSLFWKEASYNFAYFDKANINWDSAYQEYLPKVLETRSTYEYYRLLQRFSALLKDGHTNIRQPLYIQKGDINTDIGLVYIDGRIYNLSAPKRDSAILPLGSELIRINAIPVTDFLQKEILPYISYSAVHQLYNTAVNQIIRPPFVSNEKPVHLTFKSPAGDVVAYDAKVNTGNQEWVRIPDEVKYKGTLNLLPGNIAYLQIRHFRDTSIISELRRHLPQLYSAKAVILDLRNNGGDTRVGVELLKYFTDQKQIKGSVWKTPQHIAAYKAWGSLVRPKDTLVGTEKNREWKKMVYKVAANDYWYDSDAVTYENALTIPRIKAPLVVLIGNNTGSAAEDFLISLDDIKGRAITVGERTFGSTGQPLQFDLPGGGSARICTKRDTYPDGREFVGYGIKPDIEVRRTISDLLSGNDTALEKALQILSVQSNTNN